MNKELTQKLQQEFPEIFRDMNGDPKETLMCWGIDCGDGWYDLVRKICRHCQLQTDRNGYKQLVATQIKEKFGTLRFYFRVEGEGGDSSLEYFSGVIGSAVSSSGRICEVCGEKGEIGQDEYGWWKTRCSSHANT